MLRSGSSDACRGYFWNGAFPREKRINQNVRSGAKSRSRNLSQELFGYDNSSNPASSYRERLLDGNLIYTPPSFFFLFLLDWTKNSPHYYIIVCLTSNLNLFQPRFGDDRHLSQKSSPQLLLFMLSGLLYLTLRSTSLMRCNDYEADRFSSTDEMQSLLPGASRSRSDWFHGIKGD